MKIILPVCLLLVIFYGCMSPIPDRTEILKEQGDRTMQEAARDRVDIESRLAEAKNAYDTKQITYAEYLNLKNNIEILRSQYAQNLNNQMDQSYYQSNY